MIIYNELGNNIYDQYYNKLLKCSIPNAHLDLKIFLLSILHISEITLYTEKILLTKSQEKELLAMVEKRCTNFPVAYIIQQKEFMSHSFYVNEHVLIPRPDTEILVAKAIEIIREKKFQSVLEIGTGSGCIPISIKKATNVLMTATDISEEALKVAKKNSYDLQAEVHFIKSDLFENITNQYEMIISNPPYIDTKDMKALMKDVRYEPSLALHGGIEGLDYYEKIISNSRDYLKNNGCLLLEIGYNQLAKVSKLLKENGFNQIVSWKDHSNYDRVVLAML